jgi:sulfur carrier protein
MITVYLNDEIHSINPNDSLEQLLQGRMLQHCAIAVNDQLVPKQAYASTTLKANDRIDIIVPMQGG